MTINAELIITAIHWTAFLLIITLTVLQPYGYAALMAAKTLHWLTWLIRFTLRLWRAPSPQRVPAQAILWCFRTWLREVLL